MAFALWLHAQFGNYQSFKRDLVEFRGVRIGASVSEVRYALGQPKWVVGVSTVDTNLPGDYFPLYDVAATSGPNMLPKKLKATDFDIWSWEQGSESVGVIFNSKTKRVKSVDCAVVENDTNYGLCSGINSISIGDDEDEVVRLFGTPDHIDFPTGGVTKTITYDDIGLEVRLSKRKVYMWRKQAAPDVGLWWWMSHGRPS